MENRGKGARVIDCPGESNLSLGMGGIGGDKRQENFLTQEKWRPSPFKDKECIFTRQSIVCLLSSQGLPFYGILGLHFVLLKTNLKFQGNFRDESLNSIQIRNGNEISRFYENSGPQISNFDEIQDYTTKKLKFQGHFQKRHRI